MVVWSVSAALRPAQPHTVLVLVARHDLIPGSTLQAGDLDLRPVPEALAVSDAASVPDLVVGRAIASVVLSGEVVRQRDVVAAPLLGELGQGLVATPVRLSDAAAAGLVRAGDLVDILAATAGDATGVSSAAVVAARVRVLVIPTDATSAGLLGSGDSASASSGGGFVIVLVTTTAQALDLARASVRSRLSIVLRGD